MQIATSSPVQPIPFADIPIGDDKIPLGTLMQEVISVDVPDGVGAALQPATEATRDMLERDGALGARLLGLADIARESPNGVLRRLTIAPTFDAFNAARTLAYARSAGTTDPAEVAKRAAWLAVGAQRFVEGEYLPATGELLVGPLGSGAVLDLFGDDVPTQTTTRATHIVTHELAHARNPIAFAELQDPAIVAIEEGRAELVTRWTSLLDRTAQVLGQRVSHAHLAADQTYAQHRVPLEQWLSQRGRHAGPATGAVLDATRAAELVRRAAAG